MKKCKRAKVLKPEIGVDRISNLPDPILQLILQGLPNTEEVVRTSILSTRWRFLWTEIPYFPSLDIDCYRALNPSLIFPNKNFEKFVSWALANKTVELDSFRLCCEDYYYYFSTVKLWIEAAVNRKVKSLDLTFCPSREGYVLPDCLVTSDSLESLRLYTYRHPVSFPHGTTGSWGIRVLELNCVDFTNFHFVETFIDKCPLLEKLTLIDSLDQDCPVIISSLKLKTLIIRNLNNVDEGTTFEVCVSCLKLVSFEYVGPIGGFMFKNLDSLKKAVILSKDVILPQDKVDENYLSFLDYKICKVLDGISHVESLSLNHYFIQCIDVVRGRKGKFPSSFPNLKTLELTTTIDAFTVNVIIRVLRCSPNLESLHLIIQKEYLRKEFWALDEVKTRSILTRHLKTVKFLGFYGEKWKLVIARFLLEHGHALEEMVFSWSKKVEYDEKSMKMMNILSKLHKASATVKLISLLKE